MIEPTIDRELKDENGTHVTVRQYVERILEEREKLLTTRFDAQEEAIRLARSTVDDRLGKLNELRSEVLTDRANYITRERYDADMRGLDGRFTLRAFAAGGGVAVLLEILRIARIIP